MINVSALDIGRLDSAPIRNVTWKTAGANMLIVVALRAEH